LAVNDYQRAAHEVKRAQEEAQRAVSGTPGIRSVLRRTPVAPVIEPARIVEQLPGRAVVQDSDVIAENAADAHESPWRSLVIDKASPEWRVLENDPRPDASGVANAYGERRGAMVAMLSSCDAVLAVSRFVAAKFEALGVRREAITTMSIGTRMAEMAEEMKELTAAPIQPGDGPQRPLRVVFLGYHNYYKGLHVLADAMELMEPAALARVELRVHAKAVEPFEWRLERLRGRLGGLTVTRGYEYRDVPSLLSGVDVGVVPSVWWDNGPQTVLEMLAMRVPVLGAALGGIPDMVTHGVNGLLHRGNDRAQLAEQLAELAIDRALVSRLRAGITPTKTMRAHAAEIESVYLSAVRARAGTR
jgi:glycosyltransferase involved in cell wall biosynthesis